MEIDWRYLQSPLIIRMFLQRLILNNYLIFLWRLFLLLSKQCDSFLSDSSFFILLISHERISHGLFIRVFLVICLVVRSLFLLNLLKFFLLGAFWLDLGLRDYVVIRNHKRRIRFCGWRDLGDYIGLLRLIDPRFFRSLLSKNDLNIANFILLVLISL